MASAEGITVAVEQAIHGALREAIQNIERLHQIRVKDISVEWRGAMAIGLRTEFSIARITATTESGD